MKIQIQVLMLITMKLITVLINKILILFIVFFVEKLILIYFCEN